jgi:hypothetical protein
MNRIELNESPESGKPQFLYQIEVLALTFAMLGALSLYSIAFWALTNDLRLTQCFPWSDGPLSNWLIWLGLAMTLNALAANICPTRTWTERQTVLLSGLSRFGPLPRREEQAAAGQLAANEKAGEKRLNVLGATRVAERRTDRFATLARRGCSLPAVRRPRGSAQRP